MKVKNIFLALSYFFLSSNSLFAVDNDTVNIKQKIDKAINSTNRNKSFQFFNDAQKIANNQSDENWQIEPKIAKANYFKSINEYKKALSLYNEAIFFCDNNKLVKKKAKILLDISKLYSTINEHSKSYDYALNALKIYKKLNYQTGIANALKNMADELYGDYNEDADNLKNELIALKYYNEAIEIFKNNNDYSSWISALNNCSVLYMYVYKPEKSLEMLQLADDIYAKNFDKIIKTPSDDVKANMLCNKGWVYLAGIKNYPKAIKYINEAIDYCNKNSENAAVLSRNYMNLTFALKRTKQFDLVEKSCQNAIFYSKKSQDIYTQAESYLNLSALDSIKGNHSNEIVNYKFYTKLKDSINSNQKTMLLEKANIEFETEKTAQQNKELTEKNKSRTNFIIILGILLLSLLALFYFYFKSKKIQNALLIEKAINAENEKKAIQLDKILEEEKNIVLVKENEVQNRELTSKDISLQQNKNTLESAYEDLRHLNKNLNNEDSKLISKLKSSIKSNLTFTDDWQSTAQHFEKVHPDFFKHLYSLNKNLTQNDLRQCAYIKLNLSSKEIAWILNIDASSVRINRYRIKKKLILNPDLDLINYILSI